MKSQRGIILISTLLLIFFLVLVASAFINLNTNNLRLTTNVRDQELATLAAMSGVKYAQMRLEQFTNKSFGVSWGGCNSSSQRIFDNITLGGINIPSGVTAAFPSLVEQAATGVVTGTLKNGAQFRMAFVCNPLTGNIGALSTPSSYNNLSSDISVARSATYRSVPARSVHLIVVGQAGNTTRTVEVLLKKQALTDASAFAGKNLTVGINGSADDNLWYINSLDPVDNQVRANAAVNAPELGNAGAIIDGTVPTFASTWSGLQMTFGSGLKSDDPNNASLGAIVSAGKINFGAGASLIAVGETPAPANEDEEEKFAKQQTGGVLYPNTTSEKPPDLSASNFLPDTNRCNYTLSSGTYTIIAINQVELPNGTTATNTIPLIGTGGCPNVDVVVKDYMLRFPKHGTKNLVFQVVDSSGFNLELGNIATYPALAGIRAKMALGYDVYGYMSNGNYPTLYANGGDITVTGEVSGEGGLVARGGSVILQGRSVLSTDPSQGVAIYADNNVTISQIPTSGGGGGGNTDFVAYREAINPANTLCATCAVVAPSWLERWDNNSGKQGAANNLANQVVGTLSNDGTDYTITINGSSSAISVPVLDVPSTVTLAPGDATLELYVRFQQYKTGQGSDWFDTALKSPSAVSDVIKGRLDAFWDDRDNIEKQLENKLKNEGIDDNTPIDNGFEYYNDTYGVCPSSTCNSFRELVDENMLVTFKDYWAFNDTTLVAARPLRDPTGPKFYGTVYGKPREAMLQYNLATFWGQSTLTAGQSLSPQDAEFTGVIYTKGTTGFKATMGNNKFFIEGAIVALNGDVEIKNAKRVQFLYNPDYLTKFMNQTGSSVQTRLAQVFWVMW